MITSDKQNQASKTQLEMLQESFSAKMKSGVPAIIRKAGKAQLKELMDDVQAEIDEYETLKSSKGMKLKIRSIDDLMVAPIRYRIAHGMSVDAFSRKVGVSARQIHRYEASEYNNVNARTLKKILDGLDVQLDGHFTAP